MHAADASLLRGLHTAGASPAACAPSCHGPPSCTSHWLSEAMLWSLVFAITLLGAHVPIAYFPEYVEYMSQRIILSRSQGKTSLGRVLQLLPLSRGSPPSLRTCRCAGRPSWAGPPFCHWRAARARWPGRHRWRCRPAVLLPPALAQTAPTRARRGRRTGRRTPANRVALQRAA